MGAQSPTIASKVGFQTMFFLYQLWYKGALYKATY